MVSKPKIISVVISPMPKHLFDKMPTVTATFNNGMIKELFSFYPDEIRFAEQEFIGLSEDEANYLKFKKDKEFLQSP